VAKNEKIRPEIVFSATGVFVFETKQSLPHARTGLSRLFLILLQFATFLSHTPFSEKYK
jgi:hypothetical protein